MTKKKSGGTIPVKMKRVAAAEVRRTKKAVAKKPSRLTAMPTVELQKVKPKRVQNYKRHVKRLLSEAFPEIVLKMATESINGSLSHTKYLFQIGGVMEEIQRQEENKNEPNFVDLLLAEVKRRHELATATLDGCPANLQLGNGAESIVETDERSGEIAEQEDNDATGE